MKLNARVLMHLALGTSSLAMLGCEPAASAPVQRPEPVAMGNHSAPVEPARVQPDTAPESRPGAAVRFAAPPEPEPVVEPEPALEPEPAVEPEPATPVVKQRPRQISADYCPPCGRG